MNPEDHSGEYTGTVDVRAKIPFTIRFDGYGHSQVEFGEPQVEFPTGTAWQTELRAVLQT